MKVYDRIKLAMGATENSNANDPVGITLISKDKVLLISTCNTKEDTEIERAIKQAKYQSKSLHGSVAYITTLCKPSQWNKLQELGVTQLVYQYDEFGHIGLFCTRVKSLYLKAYIPIKVKCT